MEERLDENPCGFAENRGENSAPVEGQTQWLAGTSVSPGAAFGHAQMFSAGDLEIPHLSLIHI